MAAIKHYYQPTAFSCVQSAAAILLSYYDVSKTPEEILAEVPVRSWPGKDEPAGTPNQDIAAYFCKLGFNTKIISFDLWVTDLGWRGKSTEFIVSRLKAASGKLTAPMIGREGTELYIQAYLDYIEAGGQISVETAPSRQLIDGLLSDGPIFTTVAYGTLHAEGKTRHFKKLYETELDDISGNSPNHNIVISRKIKESYEVYDSWRSPGVHIIDPDRLIAAIGTAQQECDNMLVVIRPKKV